MIRVSDYGGKWWAFVGRHEAIADCPLRAVWLALRKAMG